MACEIIVDLQKLTDINCGLGQFSWHLSHELMQLDPNIGFYLPENAWSELDSSHHRYKQKSWHRYSKSFTPKSELFHSLHQEAPYLPAKNSKYVLTIHDLNFLLDCGSVLAVWCGPTTLSWP